MGSKSSVLLSLRYINVQLTTKYEGLLLREKKRTEDKRFLLGQQLKPEDFDSNQRRKWSEKRSVRWGRNRKNQRLRKTEGITGVNIHFK